MTEVYVYKIINNYLFRDLYQYVIVEMDSSYFIKKISRQTSGSYIGFNSLLKKQLSKKLLYNNIQVYTHIDINKIKADSKETQRILYFGFGTIHSVQFIMKYKIR